MMMSPTYSNDEISSVTHHHLRKTDRRSVAVNYLDSDPPTGSYQSWNSLCHLTNAINIHIYK